MTAVSATATRYTRRAPRALPAPKLLATLARGRERGRGAGGAVPLRPSAPNLLQHLRIRAVASSGAALGSCQHVLAASTHAGRAAMHPTGACSPGCCCRAEGHGHHPAHAGELACDAHHCSKGVRVGAVIARTASRSKHPGNDVRSHAAGSACGPRRNMHTRHGHVGVGQPACRDDEHLPSGPLQTGGGRACGGVGELGRLA